MFVLVAVKAASPTPSLRNGSPVQQLQVKRGIDYVTTVMIKGGDMEEEKGEGRKKVRDW